MRTKFSGILTLLLAFVVQLTFAQEKTVSGTVSDSDGLPLPTATVLIKGTTTGTTTDFDGNYSISASEGQVLQFSFVGYANQEVTVGASSTVNVTLEADNTLEEVVVTAIGIKREKKALGYSVTTVGSEDLENKAEGDIARVLNGKASGVNIAQTSGISGSGTNVIIRGYSSIDGNNQALFIVDGVPFSSDTNATGGAFVGNNGSSRFLDLNPDNIESVSVLKGLAAATLYGSQGRNGVILITTKTGSASKGALKNEVSVSQSYFVNEVASLPDYQNQFGNGFDQAFGWFFSNWGPSFNRDGLGGWGSDGAFDADGTLPHPYSTAAAATGIPAAFPQFANARYAWRPYNSVENFFRKGSTSTTNISLRGASEKVAYNVSFGHLDEEGFTPGNNLRRNTLSLGGRSQLSNKFTISGTMNYSRTDFSTPPVAESRGNGTFSAGTSSVFGHLFFTPRSVDLVGLPYQNPVDGSSVYYRQNNSIQHPLWTVNNAQVSQLTNRINSQATLQYDFNDNLNILYRGGIDVYNELTNNYQNKGGIDANPLGFLTTYNILNEIWDHSVILNGDYDLTDKVGMTFNLGATSRSESFTQIGAASTGQNIFDLNYHFNFDETDAVNNVGSRNILGVFGQAQVDYDNMLFLTLAGRNDWVSNLPTANNSLFYPSVSLSFLPTTAFESIKSEKGLNYLKLRAGLGQSARFPTGYPTGQTLAFATRFFQLDGQDVSVNTTSATKANPDLKPELQSEFEVGFDAKFIDNRVSLEASYFNRTTKDLIIGLPLPASSGFTSTTTNVGEVQGDGWEADLSVAFFRSEEADGFNWNSSVNFTTNESIVTDLGQDVDQIIYSGDAGLGGNVAREGYQLGAMVGDRIQRDANGNFVVSANGNYISESVDEEGLTPVIGDPNPDYVMNFVNTFSYKNFQLGVQVNHTVGGDISSATIATLLGRGLSTDTVDRLNSFVLPGVDVNGNANTVQINNSDYYFSNVLFGPKELTVYDASVIRLQEVSLTYSLPTKMLDKTPFGSISITASGNNLWYNAYNTPEGTNFDPGVALGVGNARGFEFINGPSGKRYGVSVKATF
jgi:TonB-linked SusC/RagA family outer membrane protein